MEQSSRTTGLGKVNGVIRVILAISSDFYLEGFRKILSSQRDIEIVAETLEYLEIIPLLKRVKHDVLLLDTAIPNLNIVSALESIKENSPDTKGTSIC